jgi:hypothetical protein
LLKGLTNLLTAGVLLVHYSASACLAGNQAALLKVMPVASWGASQAEAVNDQASAGKSSNNNGGQIAIALPQSKEAKNTEPKLAGVKSLSASAASGSRDFDEALAVVSVTAKRLAKEGGKRFGDYSQGFSALFKQQQAPPVITPGAPNCSIRRLSHAEPVTPKHPLWMLRDGRLKTVTVQ